MNQRIASSPRNQNIAVNENFGGQTVNSPARRLDTNVPNTNQFMGTSINDLRLMNRVSMATENNDNHPVEPVNFNTNAEPLPSDRENSEVLNSAAYLNNSMNNLLNNTLEK